MLMDLPSFIRTLRFAHLENKKGEERLNEHYNSSHDILLVGEGDFSFSICLAYDFGSAKNMVATTLDSREMLVSKYTMAKYNIEKLEEMGCTVIYEVNATAMASHPLLCQFRFDRIIFNFPHAGFVRKETDEFQLSLHREVLKGFFRSAFKLLRVCGQVHVTHKNCEPYNKWGIEESALNGSLYLLEEVPFVVSDFPGYENKRGAGSNCDDSFYIGSSSIFKFGTALFHSVLVSMKENSVQNDVECNLVHTGGIYAEPDQSRMKLAMSSEAKANANANANTRAKAKANANTRAKAKANANVRAKANANAKTKAKNGKMHQT